MSSYPRRRRWRCPSLHLTGIGISHRNLSSACDCKWEEIEPSYLMQRNHVFLIGIASVTQKPQPLFDLREVVPRG